MPLLLEEKVLEQKLAQHLGSLLTTDRVKLSEVRDAIKPLNIECAGMADRDERISITVLNAAKDYIHERGYKLVRDLGIDVYVRDQGSYGQDKEVSPQVSE